MNGDQVRQAIDELSGEARSRILYKADADCCHLESLGDDRYLGVHIGTPAEGYHVLDRLNHWVLLHHSTDLSQGIGFPGET